MPLEILTWCFYVEIYLYNLFFMLLIAWALCRAAALADKKSDHSD